MELNQTVWTVGGSAGTGHFRINEGTYRGEWGGKDVQIYYPAIDVKKRFPKNSFGKSIFDNPKDAAKEVIKRFEADIEAVTRNLQTFKLHAKDKGYIE